MAEPVTTGTVFQPGYKNSKNKKSTMIYMQYVCFFSAGVFVVVFYMNIWFTVYPLPNSSGKDWWRCVVCTIRTAAPALKQYSLRRMWWVGTRSTTASRGSDPWGGPTSTSPISCSLSPSSTRWLWLERRVRSKVTSQSPSGSFKVCH